MGAVLAALRDAARGLRIVTTLAVQGGPDDGGRLPVPEQQRDYGTVLTIGDNLYVVVQYRGRNPYLVFLA